MSEKHECKTCKYEKLSICDDPCSYCRYPAGRWEPAEKTYTLADLEQARRQGAEDERGRCIDAVVEATHGGALRSAVDAIRALGPIGETREETERQVRQEWVDAARAYRELTVCYRVGKRPTEKLFAALRKADALLDAIAEGKQDAEED